MCDALTHDLKLLASCHSFTVPLYNRTPSEISIVITFFFFLNIRLPIVWLQCPYISLPIQPTVPLLMSSHHPPPLFSLERAWIVSVG